MNSLKAFEGAAKQLTAAETALQSALDRLQAARDRGTPDECVTARMAARTAYREAENALHEQERLRRQRWAEIATEARTEAEAAMVSVVRYRHALRAGGQAEHMAIGLAHDALQHAPSECPDALGDVPLKPRQSPTLDRADEANL